MDPVAGRFVERDPLDYISGSDLYEMTSSNPVMHLDPFGLDEWIDYVHAVQAATADPRNRYQMQRLYTKLSEENRAAADRYWASPWAQESERLRKEREVVESRRRTRNAIIGGAVVAGRAYVQGRIIGAAGELLPCAAEGAATVEAIAETSAAEEVAAQAATGSGLPPPGSGLYLAEFQNGKWTFRRVDAHNAANFQQLKNRLAAEEISGGHAFQKHVIDRNEFPGWTRSQFQSHIEGVLNDPSEIRYDLGNADLGRVGYWDRKTGTTVIRTPYTRDGGTAFKPTEGELWFWNKLE
jgi:hypothetical protein